MLKVYFSWDDGSLYDNKISEIFLNKQLKTTFFIPKKLPKDLCIYSPTHPMANALKGTLTPSIKVWETL